MKYTRIRDLREDLDKTQEQMARELKMHKTQYQRYENAENNSFFEAVIKIANYHKVSLDYIAGRTNDKKGLTRSELSDDISQLIKSFQFLSDRRKGQIDLLMKQLVAEQEEENASAKEVV